MLGFTSEVQPSVSGDRAQVCVFLLVFKIPQVVGEEEMADLSLPVFMLLLNRALLLASG